MHSIDSRARFSVTIIRDTDYSIIYVYDSVFGAYEMAKCFKEINSNSIRPIIETLKKRLREVDGIIDEL